MVVSATTYPQCDNKQCDESISSGQKLFTGITMQPNDYMHAVFEGVAGNACAIALNDDQASVVSMAMKPDAYEAFTAGKCTYDKSSQTLGGDDACVAFKSEVSDAGHISITIINNQYDTFHFVSLNFGDAPTKVTLGHYHTGGRTFAEIGSLNASYPICDNKQCDMTIDKAGQKLFTGITMQPGEIMHAEFSGVQAKPCAIALNDDQASVVSMALKPDAYTAFTNGKCTYDKTSKSLTGDGCSTFKSEVSDAGHISIVIPLSEYKDFHFVSLNFGDAPTKVTLGHYHLG